MAATLVWAFASPAGAQSGGRIEVEKVGGGPVFDFSEIYPGATLSSVVRVSNVGNEPGNLTMSAKDIVDESRCSGAEVRAGIACGSGKGHLGEQVEFSIEHLPAGAGAVHVWSGRIDQLDDVALPPSPLAAGSSEEYRLNAHLPATSGNETQSDLLGFDLRFDLAGESDPGQTTTGGNARGQEPEGEDPPDDTAEEPEGEEVAGETGGTPGSTTAEVLGAQAPERGGPKVLGVTLPRTGAELAWWGFVGGGGLLAGSVLTLISSARNHGWRRN